MSPSTSRFDLSPVTLTWRAVEPSDRQAGQTGWSLVLAALVVLAFYAWFGGL